MSRHRPSFRRIAQSITIAAAIALPWHIYQLIVHTRWFWSEYVLTEMLAYGVHTPEQTTAETQAGFYLKRLLFLEPPLVAAAAIALFTNRSRLLIAWIALILAAALSFQYRNASYLLPVFPALVLLVARAIPRQWARPGLAAAVLLFSVKTAFPKQIWGIPFAPEFVNAAYAPLEKYASLHRGNDLIFIEPIAYGACLPVPQIRYVFYDPRPTRSRLPLDFEYLGVSVTAADFNRLDTVRPLFERRLHEFALDSGDPIGTAIIVRNDDEIASLIHENPDKDFFAPSVWASRDQLHEASPANPGRIFLLSRDSTPRR